MPVPAIKLYGQLRRAGCTKPAWGKGAGPPLVGLPSAGGESSGARPASVRAPGQRWPVVPHPSPSSGSTPLASWRR